MRITIRPYNKISIPPVPRGARRCPNCDSADIIGFGSIIGYGYINLNDLSVDEPSDEFELFSDPEDLECICHHCNYRWGGE